MNKAIIELFLSLYPLSSYNQAIKSNI